MPTRSPNEPSSRRSTSAAFSSTPFGNKSLVRDTRPQRRNSPKRSTRISPIPRAEVVIDVELITMADTSRRTLGIQLPTVFPITNFSTVLWNTPPEYNGMPPLIGFGGGRTIFGIAVRQRLPHRSANEIVGARSHRLHRALLQRNAREVPHSESAFRLSTRASPLRSAPTRSTTRSTTAPSASRSPRSPSRTSA